MTDAHGLGRKVENWQPPKRPDGEVLEGRYARLELLDADAHASRLHAANRLDDHIWDFLGYGPFASEAEYHQWVQQMTSGDDPLFYAIKNLQSGRFEGVASFLRIHPEAGSIEVGHINFAPPLQRSRAATEAMFLMMQWVYQAGYRRYEWKCNALNLGSRRAAQRLGFSYEGIFRQAAISKGRNRDTAWYASIDQEWPALKAAFETWLAADNFDAKGRQKQSLSELTRPIRVCDDPAL
ncbi:MAG: GNAT family N-acetyltransferase [Rhodobacterales bacterium]|nr:MAG: GNAT family N-acetyltransferase [Rhodobacterales bacterium]